MSKGSESITTSTRTFMAPASKQKAEPKKPRRRPNIKVPGLPWMITLVVVIAAAFMFVQYRDAEHKLKATAAGAGSRQVNDTIDKVSKLIVLPRDETPTIVTLVHADKFKGQAFFVDAKDGDKVLVYGKHKRAILYRPSQNIIVNVANVSLDTSGNTATR